MTELEFTVTMAAVCTFFLALHSWAQLMLTKMLLRLRDEQGGGDGAQ